MIEEDGAGQPSNQNRWPSGPPEGSTSIRSRVEHVFAAQKRRFDLVIRTISLARAAAKLALANLAYNFTRLAWLQTRTAA